MISLKREDVLGGKSKLKVTAKPRQLWIIVLTSLSFSKLVQRVLKSDIFVTLCLFSRPLVHTWSLVRIWVRFLQCTASPPPHCHPICALLLANRRRQGLGKESQYCIKQWHIPAYMFVCTKGEIEKLTDWSFPMVWTHFQRKVSIFFQKHFDLWCDA